MADLKTAAIGEVDATTACTSNVYCQITERVARGNLHSCKQSLYKSTGSITITTINWLHYDHYDQLIVVIVVELVARGAFGIWLWKYSLCQLTDLVNSWTSEASFSAVE